MKVEVVKCNTTFITADCERLMNEAPDRVTKKTVFPGFDMSNNSRRKKYFGTRASL